jgi:hypothetical protein
MSIARSQRPRLTIVLMSLCTFVSLCLRGSKKSFSFVGAILFFKQRLNNVKKISLYQTSKMSTIALGRHTGSSLGIACKFFHGYGYLVSYAL